jgi:DNA-directed RNA polymerase specialized sigma24 family protein
MMYDVSDDELVLLCRQKQEEAFVYLLEIMKPKQERLVRKMLYENRYCGLDTQDLMLIATQTLYLAIDSYDPTKAVFDAYYHLLLQRELTNEMKKFNSLGQTLLNTALSLDDNFEEGVMLYDVIGTEDETMQHYLFDESEQLLKEDNVVLSVEQKTMLAYYRLGYSYSEIGRIIKKNYRLISKAIQEILTLIQDRQK